MGRLSALVFSMVCAVAVVGVFSLGLGGIRGGATADAAPSNEIAVDANPSTQGMDSSITVPPGSTFSIGINVTQVAQPYYGLQFEVSWPGADLQYTGTRAVAAASPFSCEVPRDVMSGGQEMVQDGCGSGATSQTYTGRIETLEIRCLSLGTFPIHLVTQAEDPNFGTSMIGPAAAPLGTSTVDATVTCTDATATPTATSTPCPGACPTSTNTVVATATSTATATLTPCSSNCGLAIDADPSTSNIDTTRTAAVSSLFLIGIDVTLGGVSYQAMRWKCAGPIRH